MLRLKLGKHLVVWNTFIVRDGKGEGDQLDSIPDSVIRAVDNRFVISRKPQFKGRGE